MNSTSFHLQLNSNTRKLQDHIIYYIEQTSQEDIYSIKIETYLFTEPAYIGGNIKRGKSPSATTHQRTVIDIISEEPFKGYQLDDCNLRALNIPNSKDAHVTASMLSETQQ